MKILKPVTIDDASFVFSTAPEPAFTESIWAAANAYTVGQRVIRQNVHRVYRNLIAGTDTNLPELAPDRWFDEGPTNKWAWADTQISTPTIASAPYQQLVRPGAITDIALLALDGVKDVRVEMWDGPGGNLIFDKTYSTEFWGNGDPYISYYFDLPYARNKLFINGLPADTSCEVKLTLSSTSSPMEFGLIAYGRAFELGCAEYGFAASPVDYSRIKIDDYGNNYIVAGKRARDISGTVHMPVESANSIVETIHKLLGTPLLCIPSDNPANDYLVTFGLLSAQATANGPNDATLQITVKGLI